MIPKLGAILASVLRLCITCFFRDLRSADGAILCSRDGGPTSDCNECPLWTQARVPEFELLHRQERALRWR